MGSKNETHGEKCRKCGARIIDSARVDCCEDCGADAGKLSDPRRRRPGVSEPAVAAVATHHRAERRGGNGGDR